MRYTSLLLFVFTIFSSQFFSLDPISAQEPQKLAPGILKLVKPDIDPRDTHTLPMTTPGIDATSFEPKHSSVTHTLAFQSKRIVLFRDVWQYEFAFIPLRQIDVEVPTGNGNTVKRNYWYLIYRIRNTGNVLVNEEIRDPKFDTIEYNKRANFDRLTPERKAEQLEKLQKETLFGRFIGNFRLEGWVENVSNGDYVKVSYRPVIEPAVIAAIQQNEDPATELLTNVQIMKKSLPIVSPTSDLGGLWGVAVWENVDPRIDYVSVFVNGLTNAHRLERGDDGEWQTVQKTLQLNFWRAGDAIEQSEDVVDYGIPMTDDFRRQIQICRRYDLPGPVLQGFDVDEETTRRRQLIEVDAQVNLQDLESALASELDKGVVPAQVAEAFQAAGMPLPEGVSPQPTINGRQWSFETQIDGENRRILLQLTPKFWEPAIDGGIRFIKTLDQIWIYQ